MFRVRTVRDADEFVGVPGDPEDYDDLLSGLWDSGASRPEWCFLLEDDSTKAVTARGGRRDSRVRMRVQPRDPRRICHLEHLRQ